MDVKKEEEKLSSVHVGSFLSSPISDPFIPFIILLVRLSFDDFVLINFMFCGLFL